MLVTANSIKDCFYTSYAFIVNLHNQKRNASKLQASVIRLLSEWRLVRADGWAE